MRVKEKRKSILKSIYEFIETFTAVDYPDGEEIDIGKSNDPNAKILKESLNNEIASLERNFYVSSNANNSSPKGGKGNSNSNPKGEKGNNIVDRAEVDNNKAMRQAENRRVEQQEKSQEQVERGR